MRAALATVLVFAACADVAQANACGECGMGSWVCGVGCVYPSIGTSVDTVNGMTPADTGSRAVFSPSSYSGNDREKLQSAIAAAAAVGGAVVLDRIYEVGFGGYLQGLGSGGIMVTGGGIRRKCSPNLTLTANALSTDTCVSVSDATQYTVGDLVGVFSSNAYNGLVGSFLIASASGTTVCKATALGFAASSGQTLGLVGDLLYGIPTYTSGIVIDSVFFDGSNDCNDQTHDWRYNNTMGIRGANTIRNCVFYDTPSENLTTCGATVDNNRAFGLQGSFLHKSCGAEAVGSIETITNNYVDGANASGDVLMEHSEGLITFSANAGNMLLSGNRFRNGAEGVFGLASVDDEGVYAQGDCYANVPDSLISIHSSADASSFIFADVCMFNVGPVVAF